MNPSIKDSVRALQATLATLVLFGFVSVARADAWSLASAPDHFVLMRHAEAPGTGDPTGFHIGDCTTQRNLDQRGREQAKRIGAAFAQRGITFSRVLSSAWCRCVETARLVAGREPTVTPELNSFFGAYDRATPQTAELRRTIAALPGNETVLMVTHQVVITALTGVYPASGEMIVIRREKDGKLTVAGRIKG